MFTSTRQEEIMAQVVCETVGRGLRDSERSVSVRDVQNHLQYLTVDADFLSVVGDRHYLPVYVVGQDVAQGMLLIELPLEADSGANRLWVWKANVREAVGEVA
jgi:hypothetical protein